MECILYMLLGFLFTVEVVCVGMIIWNLIMLWKNNVTYRLMIMITKAIHKYQDHQIERGNFDFQVTFYDIRDYDEVLNRFWDWGYEHILPPEKLELIRPFIKED